MTLWPFVVTVTLCAFGMGMLAGWAICDSRKLSGPEKARRSSEKEGAD